MIDKRRPLTWLLFGAALTCAVGPPGCGGDETQTPTTTTASTSGGTGGTGTTSSATGGTGTTSSATGGTGTTSSATGGAAGGTTSSATGGSGGQGTTPAYAPLMAQGLAGGLIGKSGSYKMILAIGAPASPAHASSETYQLQCIVDDQGSATP